MALLVDTPRWPWRGKLWAHLISDVSLDELHDAARKLGLRWLSFGRDHYDVPDDLWPDTCEIAELVDPRIIVRSLRTSGLRVPGGKPAKAWRWRQSLAPEHATPEVLGWLQAVRGELGEPVVEYLERPDQALVLHLLDRAVRPDLGSLLEVPYGASGIVETVADGRYSVELILEKQSATGRSTMPTRPDR